MAKSVTISIRVKTSLLEELGKVAETRNEFVVKAIEERLARVLGGEPSEPAPSRPPAVSPTDSPAPAEIPTDAPPLDVSSLPDASSLPSVPYTPREQRRIVQAGKRLADIMNDLLIAEAGKRQNFLEGLTNEDLAKLVVSRLPKESSGNAELEEDVLSLKKSIEALPSIDDLTHELRRVKGLVVKLETERDIMKGELKVVRNRLFKLEGRPKDGYAGSVEELMTTMYEKALEYAVDLAARNSFPGIGDGGGLSESGYAAIGRKVKSELGKLDIGL